MHDPIKQPKYWPIEQRRAKAMQLRYADPREMLRMMRVAEEYDKLADHCADWQASTTGDGKT
jgi:hypothetical protein